MAHFSRATIPEWRPCTDANAARLRAIIREIGWPTEPIVGADGARAAWRIAQHSINHPDFMRECRTLLDLASAKGEVPRSQFAYIDDRIRVYEGLPQRYGTQWRGEPNGLEPYPLEDSIKVDEWRAELGLPSLAEMQATVPPPKAALGSQRRGGEGSRRACVAKAGRLDSLMR